MFCMCLRCIIRNNQKRQAEGKNLVLIWSRNKGAKKRLFAENYSYVYKIRNEIECGHIRLFLNFHPNNICFRYNCSTASFFALHVVQ